MRNRVPTSDVEREIPGECIPCCNWKKICNIPGDPPQVTPLDYYNVTSSNQYISYSRDNNWLLFDGFTTVGYGTSDNVIITGTGSTTPIIDGAYCLTCDIPNNPSIMQTPTIQSPIFTKILNINVTLGYNILLKRWEIKNCGTILYTNDSDIINNPPFNGWVKVGIVYGNLPLVLNNILPSSTNWTII